MKFVLAFLLALFSASLAQAQGVPKSFQANICGTVTTSSAPVCVNDGNGGNPQWGTINPLAHTFTLTAPIFSFAIGTPVTGCANNGGIFYNAANTFGCTTTITTDGVGRLNIGDGTTALPSMAFLSDTSYGFLKSGSSVYYTQNGTLRLRLTAGAIYAPSNGFVGFSSTTSAGGTQDTAISRTSAGVVEVNTGTIGAFGDLRIKNVVANSGGIYSWSTRSQVLSPADGNVLLQDTAGTAFGLLQLGGLTNAYPAIKRVGAAIQTRLADDSGFADLQMQNINANGNISVLNTGLFAWGTNSRMRSLTDGNILLQNSGFTSFNLLQFGGTTNLFPAIRRDNVAQASFSFVTADNSAFAPIFAGPVASSGDVTAGTGSKFITTSKNQISSPVDGNTLITNNAGTSFGLLQLGGTTASFPAIKRNNAQVDFRLADDTAYANVTLGALTTGSTINAGGNITAPATASYFFNGRSRISSPADGNIQLGNNANATFNMLQFGGVTSAFPALKSSGTTIAARVADDTADATLTALTQSAADNSNKVATTAWGQSQGWMKFTGITSGTRSGNTSVFATTSGALSPGSALTVDANGNIISGTPNPIWFSVKDYKASGSASVTTGTTNGTTALTLAAAIDFVNGQGIRINAAGPMPTVTNASSPGVVYTGNAGSTTYSYRIAAIDSACGIRAATTAVTASSAETLVNLGYTNYNTVSWSAVGGATRYVVWRSVNGGAYSFLTVIAGLSFQDGGFDLGYVPDCIPNTPTAADQPQWLVTSIVSGAGTTNLVLANAATQTGAGKSVQHDDTAAINAAVTAAGNSSFVLFPCGYYKTTGSINLTFNDQTVKGMGACSDIQGYGVADDIVISGTNMSTFVNNVTFSDIYLRAYNKFGGKTIRAQYFFNVVSENVFVLNPWGGNDFSNFNTLVLTNWNLNRYWGSNEVAYYFRSGPSAPEYACCVFMQNVAAVGLSKLGGFSDIQIDKSGFVFDGNVATIQGFTIESIEIAGKAFSVANGVGNPRGPEFYNIHDLETEFTNDRAINLQAGLNFNFNNPQIHGARENNIAIVSGVSNVNITGGFSSGAKNNGILADGTNMTFTGMQIYDNANPGTGGTPGLAYGIEFGANARRFATSSITVGTPATSTQQFCGIAIQAGADHFNVSGVSSADSNVNGGACNNTGGTSSSKIVNVAN